MPRPGTGPPQGLPACAIEWKAGRPRREREPSLPGRIGGRPVWPIAGGLAEPSDWPPCRRDGGTPGLAPHPLPQQNASDRVRRRPTRVYPAPRGVDQFRSADSVRLTADAKRTLAGAARGGGGRHFGDEVQTVAPSKEGWEVSRSRSLPGGRVIVQLRAARVCKPHLAATETPGSPNRSLCRTTTCL